MIASFIHQNRGPLVLALGTHVVYALLVVLAPVLGLQQNVVIFSFIPAIGVAVAFGMRIGMANAVFLVAVENNLAFLRVGVGVLALLESPGNIAGTLFLVATAVIVGRLRDLRLRLRASLAIQSATHSSLIESRERYRRIVEGLRRDHFFYSHDVNGIFTYLSPSITDVLGYTQGEFLEHYTEHLTDATINGEVVAHTDRSIRGEIQPPYEVELYHKNGDRRRIEVSETPVFDESGRVIAVEGIAHDTTARWIAQRERMESEAGFRAMFESTSEGVALISPLTGRFIAANPAMCAMFEYTSDEFLSLSPEDITPPEAKEMMRSAMRRLSAESSVPDHEGVSITKSGKRIDVIVSNRRIPWKGADTFHVTFKDITFVKQIQRRLEEKNQAILDFTNMVTHDLRNPLAGIKGALGILRSTDAVHVDMDASETVDLASQAVSYMEQLVNDLLDIARTESGARNLELEDVAVRDVVDRVMLRLKPQAQAKGISVTVHIDGTEVRADARELSKVFTNLIGNAIAYMGERPDPRIVVGMTNHDGAPTFFVQDNGMGIPVESQPTIFDKFKRGSNVHGIKGTGLGLAIVKGIVEAHGGKVWVKSEVGEGTAFFFTLADGAV